MLFKTQFDGENIDSLINGIILMVYTYFLGHSVHLRRYSAPGLWSSNTPTTIVQVEKSLTVKS